MGLSCRCCKKKGRCACKACPTIASESLALEIDYKQFDIDGQPFDSREDVPSGPLFGPEPPYPEGFEINATCGYAKPKITSDLEQGINGCGQAYPPFDYPLPCGEFAATMIDPETNEPYQVVCPEGYTCDGAKSDEVGFCEPIPGEVSLSPECVKQYDKYTCEGNGPRMGRVGPNKKSTFFGIGLIPENKDLIECTDGQTCPEGYECVESTDPPEKIQIKPPLDTPQSCETNTSCPDGYECQCGKCEPEKVDAPIKSFCKLKKTECSDIKPCPEGHECVTDPDTDESFCEPISGELTKDFLQHPIQAQFGLYPCKNPHKNEVCAPLVDPIPCDIPDCAAPIGKLPDQCEKCTDSECVDHFGVGYKCNRDGDCEKGDSNPCPEGYECRLDPANPLVEDFPSEVELPFGYIGCIDTDCEKEYGPGFKCNNNGNCEIDPEDGTDTNCELLFGGGSEYYPTKPMRDAQGRKYVCDPSDPDAQNCEQLTGDSNSICEDGECHQIIPNCQKIPTNCLPIEIANEPDWIFEEHDGLPVFLVPTDGLPYGPLPLDGEGGARKRRYDELWKGGDDDDPDKLPKHIGACNEVDVNNGECSPDCCYETFGDPWLPNHKWKCATRTVIREPLEEPNSCEKDKDCPSGYECINNKCEPANLLPELETTVTCDPDNDILDCPDGYYCVGGTCKPKAFANPDIPGSGLACYLEPINPYSNKEDGLDSLIRDFPEFRELECPDIDQYCGADAGTETHYFEPNSGGSIPADCAELASENGTDSYCEKLYGLGFECEEAQPTGITDCETDTECETKTGLLGSKCVTLADGSKECYTPLSCFKDNTKCPNGYDCINDQCQVDCEAEYGPGAKCVDLVEPGDKEDRWCQPPCSDDICEEEYGPGFKCNDDGDCEAIRDRDLDSRIPRPIGEKSTYNDRLYLGHTSIWGGNNDSEFGVGVFNLDTTKIRTRLYLDYGYHLHYPFDKGHMETELVPSGCPIEKTPKTDVWRYKGNKGHRHPYPKVHTIAIGNRYPSVHSFIDDEKDFDFDDFTKIGSGPYFAKYCDRAMGTDEPGGLLGLGDPTPTNWNREANPSEDADGNTIYAPQHENDDYGPKYDPNGVVKGCDPAFVVPCDTNPKSDRPFEYLNYQKSEEDGLTRTGVCKKDMDDWRVSNQSVFSHNRVPSGPVGGLIIDKVDFVPVDYHFPAHTTSPDMWLWPGLTEYGSTGGMKPSTKNNRVFIPRTTLPVYLAVYYNSKIGRKPIRYDELDINQFLPPPNGWLENIWQLGDIANPLNADRSSVAPHLAIEYSRPVNDPNETLNARAGYKYWAMSMADYTKNYKHLPVDRHWDKPSEETCVEPRPDFGISCATGGAIKTRWMSTQQPCPPGGDCKSHATQECLDAFGGDYSKCVKCIEGYCYNTPGDECTSKKCNDLFDPDGSSFSCHPNGYECIQYNEGCPDGYTCGPPDYDRPIVEPLPSQDSGRRSLQIYEIEMEVTYTSIDGTPMSTTVKPDLVTGTGLESEDISQNWLAKSQAGIENTISQQENYHQAINHGIETPYWDEYLGGFKDFQIGQKEFPNESPPPPTYKDSQLFKNDPPEDQLYLNFIRKYDEDWDPDSTLDNLFVYFQDMPDDAANIIDVKVKVRQKGHSLFTGESPVPVVGYSIWGSDTSSSDQMLTNQIAFYDGSSPSDVINKVFRRNQPCPEDIDKIKPQWQGTDAPPCVCEDGFIEKRPDCVVPSTDVLAFEINPGYSSKSDWDGAKLQIFFSPVTPTCGALGEGFKYVDSQVIPSEEGRDCWKDEHCEEDTGIPGSICIDGDCVIPPTCQQPDRFCTPCNPCESDPEQGFYLQSCGDDQQSAPPITQSCGPDDLCPPGYRCEDSKCEPIPGSDDIKLTKHLFDFWNNGTPFPSNNGDVTDARLTWFRAELDQYGEIQLKPSINTRERDLQKKWPEKNLFGVEPPEEFGAFGLSCENDPCPPGYKCDSDSNLCVPGEGSLESQVTYPPLLYTGGTSGGYKISCGIVKEQMDSDDRAIKQWWFEEPYHPGNPVTKEDKLIQKTFPYERLMLMSEIGAFYAVYLAQIGVSLRHHAYDLDWLGQQLPYLVGTDPAAASKEIANHMEEDPHEPHTGCFSIFEAGREIPGSECGNDQHCEQQTGIPGSMCIDGVCFEPADCWDDDHTDVREVYRMAVDPVEWNIKRGTWIDSRSNRIGLPGRYCIDISADKGMIPENSLRIGKCRSQCDRSMVGRPTGSYHGRDGMIRYNIHPWAQIYHQMRITDSLLEMGRDFHEVQKVLSSIELECRNGIFKNGTPTIVEPFGYNEMGNIQFELNQPHGSHFAELTTPRILNYRPMATSPPGNADRIKIGGPGQAMCIYEYQYPYTVSDGGHMSVVFMPGGGLYKPWGFGMGDPKDYNQPFVSRVLGRPQTYPGWEYGNIGESGTKYEEDFIINVDENGNREGGVETEFGLVEFYQGSVRTSERGAEAFDNIKPHWLHGGTYIQGKVYGASKWPWDNMNSYIAGTEINSESYPRDFYIGGHGYFDPKELQKAGLQNLDPDKGLFTYCFIAGMTDTASLPGLPKGWTFGMVGGSFHWEFNHRAANGNANAPPWNAGDFDYPSIYENGTTKPNYGPVDFLQKKKEMGTFGSHYFDKYDYPGNLKGARDTRSSHSSEPNIDVEYIFLDQAWRFQGNIVTGTLTRLSDGSETSVDLRGNRASEALVKHFMAVDMTEDPTEFLKQYYYAQVVKVRGNGPITNTTIPMDNMFDVAQLKTKDVHLILKREGTLGRLIEGPQADTWQDFPQAPHYYKTAKYQRGENEDCVDTYDKECAVGGSSPCGDTSEEGLVLYTLDKNEKCEDCAKHKDQFLIDTDDWVCVEGKFVREDDPEGVCQDDQYCQDMYGPGYICAGEESIQGAVCLTDQECEDQTGIPGSTCRNGECVLPGRCQAPMTCQIQGLLPANMDSVRNGIMDVIGILPSNTGLESVLPMVYLDSYLEFVSDDPTKILKFKDMDSLDLYYIVNQYGSDGSIAPNGQIITDEILRNLHPNYFYDANGDPTRVSLRGAVLDARIIELIVGETTIRFRRVFFSVGHPDARPDFAPQEYICAKMTDPATGLHNSELERDMDAISYGAADMTKCIKTSRFYSGERSDYVPLYGNITWPWYGLADVPPAQAASTWDGGDDKDVLGVTPFHWPWAIGDLCVDWAAGSPRRGGNMGSGIDGRHGFNHENALENVKKYYYDTIDKHGPQDNKDLERTVTHNEFPNSYEAALYKLAIISGTTNTGDMEFISDRHRQKNDILQAKPPCKLWTNIHDFKWPLTPATGINTPITDRCDRIITPEGESTADTEEQEGEPRVNTVHGNLKIHISEKPIIHFRAGGTTPGVSEPDKLWFDIDDDGCGDEDIEEYDPPVPCDPNTDCGDDYECREIEGCDDQNTYCMPKKCTPTSRALKEYREELGFHHLVLQPTTNPLMYNHVRCPIHHVEIPHWGPQVQLKSALFNRDLITIDECSACDIDCDCREPGDPEPLPPLDPEQICGRWDGDEECDDGYDCLCHTCQQPPFKKCLKADAYGCRKCLEPTSPAITITEPEDYSNLLLDPDADKRQPLNIDCKTAQVMEPNSGNVSSCDDDADCQSRLKSPNYSDFRDANPDVTEDGIFCKDDDCQFYPVCPQGYECGMTRCNPMPFGDVPPLNGTVDITVNVTPGSGAGTGEDSSTPELTKFEVKRVIFTTVQIQSEDPDANDYLKPILDTTLTVEGVELEDGVWGIEWDTTNSVTGYTPDGIFEIKAAVYDTGDLWCLDIATVRLGELDDSHNKAVDEIYNELLAL